MGRRAETDPSVAAVEAILDRGATRRLMLPTPGPRGPLAARRAAWLCACVTMADAPTWLIYEDLSGALRWCRVADGVEISEVMQAELSAGGHADPSVVLAWLEGRAAEPWGFGGHGEDEHGVLDELLGGIRGRPLLPGPTRRLRFRR